MSQHKKDLMSKHNFAVDLITLYHPEFWGVSSREDVAAKAAADPTAFWDRMLDTVAATGATGIEVTFVPGDLDTGFKAYGSPDGLREAVAARGLEIISGYFGVIDGLKAPLDPAAQDSALEAVAAYSQKLRAAGGSTVVSGLPATGASVSRGASGFLDFDYLEGIADLVNRIGARVRDIGLTYAIHPEAGSVFCRRREIDLLLALTDPDVVSFCPDTAHLLLANGDPVAIVEGHRERVVLTHWKDAAGPLTVEIPDNEHRYEVVGAQFMPVGDGAVDWKAWSKMLDRIGYQGWTILEVDDCPDPDVQIARAKHFVETSLG